MIPAWALGGGGDAGRRLSPGRCGVSWRRRARDVPAAFVQKKELEIKAENRSAHVGIQRALSRGGG